MTKPDEKNWFLDYWSDDAGSFYQFDRELAHIESPFQDIKIIHTPQFGLMLILDGRLQSSENDEFIYHEALVMPSMIAHPNPEKVFIAGGGEGATLRDVLRHKLCKKVVMVDIDRQVVEASKRYLPSWHRGAYEDERVTLIHDDARKVLAESEHKFDVIINDVNEPIEEGPANLLFTKEFWSIAADKLNPGGIVVVQSGSASIPEFKCIQAVYYTMKQSFPLVSAYYAGVPSFGCDWGFITGSFDIDPAVMRPAEADEKIAEFISGELRFYSGETHGGLFRLPKYMRRALKKSNRLITDDNPLYIYVKGEAVSRRKLDSAEAISKREISAGDRALSDFNSK